MDKFIPLLDWVHSELTNKECLYGYSYKSKVYFPYSKITEVKTIGKTGRLGVSGFAENGDKLYIQLNSTHMDKIKELGWLSKFLENESN